MENKKTGYPTIDKPWEKYYDRKFDETEIPNMSIYQLALDANENNMENIAIDMRSSMNNYEKGIIMTYSELFKRIDESAKSSKEMGIKTNEIVPFVLPNLPEARILTYSNSVIGATSYPVSPLMPSKELERFINENGIKNLFLFEAFVEKYGADLKNTDLESIVLLDGSESLPNNLQMLKRLKDKLTGAKKDLWKLDKRYMPWHEYEKFSKKSKENIDPYYADDHVTAIIGTSGTTGSSKGVCLTDKNVNTAALSYVNGKLFDKPLFMDALLPSIGYGISLLHYETVAGKHVYLIPELLTTRFPEVLTKLKPDNFTGGPVHYINLRNSKEFKEGILPKTQNNVSGGASLPQEIEKTLNKVDVGYQEGGLDDVNENLIVRQGYGLTEDTALGSYCKRGAYKFGSIGVPVPYLTVGIFEPNTDKELKYNEQGEICIHGPGIMKEYLNNPEETEKVVKIHSDGKRWIHTKDIGYMDEDGHIFLIDRIKNIFMRTGFNVHPAKISEFINTIPGVNNSVVVGFDHPEEQCVPVAFVEHNKDITSKTDDEFKEILADLCHKNLEETSVPYDFVFVDTLPINVGGKIDLQKIKNESGIDYMNKGQVRKRIHFNE